MTLPQYLHLYSYHLCAQDLTLTLKSVIQLGRLCSMANARMKRMNSLDVSRQNKILNILKPRKMIWWDAGTQKHTYGYGESASRRVEESKVDLRQKSKNIESIKKKMKYQDKTKFSTFSTSRLVKWFCDMLAARNWIFCQKSAILKKHKICAWKDDTYIAFWEMAKYQGIRGKYRAISEKRWKE
jgi:hypothetical protein